MRKKDDFENTTKPTSSDLHIHPCRVQQIQNLRIGFIILVDDLAFVLDKTFPDLPEWLFT